MWLTSKSVGIISVGVLVSTIILRWVLIAPTIKMELSKKLKLQPGTDLWEIWKDLPIPIFIKFHFFNVTNPMEILEGGKPKLVQVGPYVYQEKRTKIILSVNETMIKYRPRTIYTFRPDMSYGGQDDNITLLNVPYIGVIKMAWGISKEPFILRTLDSMLREKGETLFHTNQVHEFLFDGFSIENYMDLLSLPIAEIFSSTISVPERLKDGNFGFYDDKNGTSEDVYIIDTGAKNPEDFGKIIYYNGNNKLSAWKSDECNKLDGTDGSIFQPFADKNRILRAYAPEMCRTVKMVYESPSEFMGIPTLKFKLDKSVFGTLDEYPENECYCKDTWEYCTKGSVISVAPCTGGAPIFISPPHFANAPNFYKDMVDGISPDEDFRSHVEIEPNLGLPIKGVMKMQVNIDLENYSYLPQFSKVKNTLFPLIWVEESAELSRELSFPIIILSKFIQYADIFAEFFVSTSIIAIVMVLLWEVIKKKWQIKPT